MKYSLTLTSNKTRKLRDDMPEEQQTSKVTVLFHSVEISADSRHNLTYRTIKVYLITSQLEPMISRFTDRFMLRHTGHTIPLILPVEIYHIKKSSCFVHVVNFNVFFSVSFVLPNYHGVIFGTESSSNFQH